MDERVEVTGEREVFRRGFMSLKEATVRYERFDGQMSEPATRLYFDRGDSVAALLHDAAADTLTLVEQFRYPAYVTGHGWLLELPAGVVERDSGESEEVTMRREIMEETGYAVASLEPITTCYPSPGGSSERIFLYYARISGDARRGPGGGADLGEDTRVVTLPVEEALRRLDAGEIVDAKTIIALQWLAHRRADR